VPARLGFALLTLSLCAFAAMAGVWLAARDDGSAAVETGPDGWAGFVRPPGATVPAFRLRDQDGQRVTSREYANRAFVVTFVYSTCEDTCPAMIDQVRGALDDTGLEIPLLAVSVDPANDTPARARRFLNERRMTGRARFLLGTRAELEPVWRGFGVQPQTDALEHSATVVLVDADGAQRVGFPHAQLTPEALAHDLERLRRVAGATA
jgi:protein SCO1/2